MAGTRVTVSVVIPDTSDRQHEFYKEAVAEDDEARMWALEVFDQILQDHGQNKETFEPNETLKVSVERAD